MEPNSWIDTLFRWRLKRFVACEVTRILAENESRCMDDERDRQALAASIMRAVDKEVPFDPGNIERVVG